MSPSSIPMTKTVGALAVFTMTAGAAIAAAPAQKPDILVVFTDQWSPRETPRWNTRAKTPNLDAVAREGMRFYSAYSPCPISMPARTCLLTGQYPHNTGLWYNTSQGFAPLAWQARLFADVKAAGYTTAQIGKLHWTNGTAWRDQQHFQSIEDFYRAIGVDHADSLPPPFSVPGDKKGPYGQYLRDIGKFDSVAADMTQRMHGDSYAAKASVCTPEEHNEMFVANRAVEFLEKQPADKPMLLVVSFFGPHSPIDPPEPYASMYNPADMTIPPNVRFPVRSNNLSYDEQKLRAVKAGYLGKMSYIDACAGKVFEALKKRGNWENTLVVFIADHGELMGTGGGLAKGQLLEESVGIPLWVRPPSGTKVVAGESDAPVNLVDVYATLVEAAGGKMTPQRFSRSLLPIVRGEAEDLDQRAAFAEIQAKNGALTYMVRKGDFKFFLTKDGGCLYNLKDDPYELKNLAGDAAHAEKVRELKDAYADWVLATQINYAAGYKPRLVRLREETRQKAESQAPGAETPAND